VNYNKKIKNKISLVEKDARENNEGDESGRVRAT
jgi:hypothetical protein